MKIAKTVCLFKSGENSTFSNYRPVSLLPQFSEVLAKMFDKRLTKFVENIATFLVNLSLVLEVQDPWLFKTSWKSWRVQ